MASSKDVHHRSGVVAAAALLVVGTTAGLRAQDCTLTPSSAFRGADITITGKELASAATGTIEFRPLGSANVAATVSLPEAARAGGASVFTIPTTLPLGAYNVSITSDNNKCSPSAPLYVALSATWPLRLFEFEPGGTYDTEPVWVQDAQGKARKLSTVSMTLRGSGFLTDVPKDNRILVNGKPLDVTWDGCAAAHSSGTEAAPLAKNEVHGQVASSERIELCGVPVPDSSAMRVSVAHDGRPATESWEFRAYQWSTVPVAAISAAIALSLGLVVLSLVKMLKRSQPVGSDYSALTILFLDPETDTYSLSKLQFYFWTAAAVFGYVYLVIGKMLIQGQGWPDIPASLPGIIGVGAATAVGAQFVTNIRGPKGGGGAKPSVGDLVTSGGVAAPERVQMLVWTVLGVVGFCLAVVQHEPGSIKALDKVPDGLLYMMGLSSVGYLGGKLARKPGPIINEISITPSESDAAIAGAQAPPAGPPDLSLTASQARATLNTFANVPAGDAHRAVNALQSGVTAVRNVKTFADAQAVLADLAKQRETADAAAKAAADEFAQPGSNDNSRMSAEMAQGAAAALHVLSAAVSSTLGASTPAATSGPGFTRIIEVRGRNLSNQALIEIDGSELPFRMLRPDREGKRQPDVVVHEPEDTNLALVLRLAIDPGQLEDSDFKQYKRWFGTSDPSIKRTLTVINLDGQKADIAFTIPPAAAQNAKTGQDPAGAPKASLDAAQGAQA